LKNIPEKFEAGTQNLSGILGLGSAIEYLEKNRDEVYLQELKKYALSKMKEISQIKIYNEYSKGPIIIFNVNNVFSQDTAIYLSKKKIAIRSGNHCAKLLNNLGLNNTCRLSLYFYNTKEEIDSLIKALNNENILEESL
jgi:cysteine desulfurase/selenocysteine lyase